jgi:hypothetical protein
MSAMHVQLMVDSGQRFMLLDKSIKYLNALTHFPFFGLQSPAPTAQPTLLKAHSAAAATPQRSRAPAQARVAVNTQAP